MSHVGISEIGYIALLAKNSGMVSTWPMPIILSRVFRKDARTIEKLEKHIAHMMVTTKTPAMSSGLNLRFTPIIRASATMTIPWNIPLTADARALPMTMEERGEGVESSFVSSPTSLSQTIVMP